MDGIGGAKKWHNYFNPNDWALGLWVFNQSQKPAGVDLPSILSPLELLTTRDYKYLHLVIMDQWGFWVDERGSANDHGLYFDSPDSTYEIFSYCAQARSNPTGRQTQVGGPFSTQLNFSEFGDVHPGHSAQFLNSICERWKYWHMLLTSCDIKHINDLNQAIK